jgi:DNA-binding NarL/FixJ family response regulator
MPEIFAHRERRGSRNEVPRADAHGRRFVDTDRLTDWWRESWRYVVSRMLWCTDLEDDRAVNPAGRPRDDRPRSPRFGAVGDAAGRLAGREAEVGRIVGAHAEGRRLVVIHGEQGAGKSAVIDEAVARATARGTTTLIGRCPRNSVSALEPLWQAFGPLASTWTSFPAALHPMKRDVLRVLGPAGAHLGSSPIGVAEPGALAAALTGLAAVAGGSGRALLAIDDLHLGDADLRLLLGSVARSSAPLCAVVTLTGSSTDAAEFLEEVAAPDAVCVALDGLDESAVRQIVLGRRTDASPQLIDELHQRSGGNALFLVSMLDSDSHLSGIELPESIVDGVSRRLAALPDRERAICEAIAAVGRTCPFGLVQHLVDLSDGDVVAGLRRLQDLRLVVERPADHFSFRSPMVAAVASANTLSRQRHRLHSAVLEMIDESDTLDPAIVFSHASAIGDTDRAVPAARAASTAALECGAPARAARLANEGLAYAPHDVVLLLAAAEAEVLCGAFEATERHAMAAIAAASASASQRAEGWRVLARTRWQVGDGLGRDEALDQAAALLPFVPSGPERALIHLAQAESAMIADDVARTLDALDAARAQISGPESGDERLSVALDVIEGSVLASRPEGVSARGIALLDQALPLAVRAGDIKTAGRALNNLVHAMIYRSSAGATARVVDELDALSSRVEGYRPYVRLWRAVLGESLGDADVVAAHIGPHEMPADAHDLCVHLVGVSVLLDQHRLDEAAAVLTIATPFAVARADPELEWWTTCLSLERRALDGEQVAEEILQQLEREPLPTLVAADKAGRLALVAARQWPGATGPLTRALGRWLDSVSQASWALHLEALTAAANGDHEAAIASANASARDPHPRGAAARADAWIVAARSCAAIGDRKRGREFAQMALDTVERWPGTTHDESASVLRSLGGRPTARRSAGLTPREREVAKLIAAGLANAEIGRRLDMSPRTVGVHVTHILNKLGATNRTEIAIHAMRSGLAE